LTAERRTHGGYPAIATIATVDLPIIAQSKPGDRFKFELIDLTKAQDLLKQENDFFKNFYTFVEDLNMKLFNL
jgi:antagonist of KipI